MTFNLGGHTYSTLGDAGVFSMGSAGFGGGVTGSLTLLDGTLDTFTGRVGSVSNSNSTLTLGSGGQLVARDSLAVGRGGTGTILVNSAGSLVARELVLGTTFGSPPGNVGSGTLSVIGVNATATVSGASVFGDNGASLVEVRHGGSLNTQGAVFLGNGTGSNSSVTIVGESSHWNLDGTIVVSGSGASQVSVHDGVINAVDSSFALGPNSQMRLSGNAKVHISGAGSLGLQVQGGFLGVSDRSSLKIESDVGLIVSNTGTLFVDGGDDLYNEF